MLTQNDRRKIMRMVKGMNTSRARVLGRYKAGALSRKQAQQKIKEAEFNFDLFLSNLGGEN